MRYKDQAYVLLLSIIFGVHSIYSGCNPQGFNFFDSYQNHVATSKQALSGFTVHSVEFAVQKNAKSTETFNRKAFLALRPQALGTVIICHGYTHSKVESFFFKSIFSHFNVLAFDFRAHGELVEKNQYSTIGQDEIYDVLGAVKFVRSQDDLAKLPLIGFGFSMGAVALLRAQAENSDLFDALILDSPFDSSDDCMSKNFDKMLTVKIFNKEYQVPGKKLIMNILYSDRMRPVVKPLFKWASGMNPNTVPTKFVPVDPLKNAANIKIPCFFISCGQDKSVGVESVQRLYDTVQSSYKRFWVTKGRKHCDSYVANPELYMYQVNKFIKKALQKSFSQVEKIRDDRVSIEASRA